MNTIICHNDHYSGWLKGDIIELLHRKNLSHRQRYILERMWKAFFPNDEVPKP